MRKNKPDSDNIHHKWLNLLLLGGFIFGIVDHIWHGELFLVGNLFMDLALGVTITLAIIVAWLFIVSSDKIAQVNTSKTNVRTNN